MHQIDGAVALQFAQHVRPMNVHRLVAEVELEGDLFYAVAFDQQLKHFALAWGQYFQYLRGLLAAA